MGENLANENKKILGRYTLRIPEKWKEIIRGEHIQGDNIVFENFEEDESYLENYTIQGWKVIFASAEPNILDVGGTDYEERFLIERFSLDDINRGTIKTSEFEEGIVEVRCVWSEQVEDISSRSSGSGRFSSSLGFIETPESDEEKLIEIIDSSMSGGIDGYYGGLHEVVYILDEYDIGPNSRIGQHVIKTYIEHALEEYYGDFSRYLTCDECGEEYEIDFSVGHANRYIERGHTMCSRCEKKEE